MDAYTAIHPFAASADASKLIGFSSEQEAKDKRAKLISYLWGSPTLPKTQAPWVASREDNTWPNLSAIDTFNYSLPYAFKGSSAVFRPIQSNKRLMVYHEGHNPSYLSGANYIKHFLSLGFTVAAFSMPTFSPNNQPTLYTQYGQLIMSDHRSISLLNRAPYSPLVIFLEPVIQVLNSLAAIRDYSDVSMSGYSGGGWTTHLCSALDERITRSYPVAGSLPKYLKTLPPNDTNATYGDWEQNYPEFFQQVDYVELYALATTGGRRQIQILNQHDPCCFAGVNYRSYEQAVTDVAASWGGHFEVWLDENNPVHSISDEALSVIDEDLS